MKKLSFYLVLLINNQGWRKIMKKAKIYLSILLSIIFIMSISGSSLALQGVQITYPDNSSKEWRANLNIVTTFEREDDLAELLEKYICPEYYTRINIIALDKFNFKDYIDSHISDIDIMLLDNYYIEPKEAIKRWQPLEIDDYTIKSVKEMPKALRAEITDGKHVYAYPFMIISDCFVTNLGKYYGSGLNGFPTTFNEYIDQMLEWYRMNIGKNPNYTFDNTASDILNHQLATAENFIFTEMMSVNKPPFDTPEFRLALEKLYSLNEFRHFKFNFDDDYNHESIYYHSFPYYNNPLLLDRDIEDAGLRWNHPLVANNTRNPIIPSRLLYVMINKNARKDVEAKEFLNKLLYNLHHPTNEYEYTTKEDDLKILVRSKAEIKYSEMRTNIDIIKNTIDYLEPQIRHSSVIKKIYEEKKQELEKLELECRDFFVENTIAKQNNIKMYREIQPYIGFNNYSEQLYMLEALALDEVLTDYFEGRASIDETLTILQNKYQDYKSNK